MVNETILNYIKENLSKYNLEDIKKKIISSGYKPEDVNEAIDALNLEKRQSIKNSRLILVSSFVGLFLLILAIVIYGSIFFINPFRAFSIEFLNGKLTLGFSIIFSLISIVFFSIMILLFLGFLKSGNYSESRWLKISSKFSVIVMSSSLVLLLIEIIVAYMWEGFLVRANKGGVMITGQIIGNGQELFGVSGRYLTSFGIFMGYIWAIIFFIFLACFLFLLISLFFSKNLRFSRSTGIFGILFLLVSCSLWFYINRSADYYSLNFLVEKLTKNAKILASVFFLFLIIYLFFQYLLLFYSSKRFEFNFQ